MIKKVILPCLAALNLLAIEPRIGLFELETTPQRFSELAALGADNLSNSQKLEPNTLAMFFTSAADKPEQTYVLEIYADEAAYEARRQAPHFKEFVRDCGDMVVKFEGFSLKNNYSFSKAKFGDF